MIQEMEDSAGDPQLLEFRLENGSCHINLYLLSYSLSCFVVFRHSRSETQEDLLKKKLQRKEEEEEEELRKKLEKELARDHGLPNVVPITRRFPWATIKSPSGLGTHHKLISFSTFLNSRCFLFRVELWFSLVLVSWSHSALPSGEELQ